MQKQITFTTIIIFLAILIFASSGIADSALQLALFNPVQIVDETESITGARFNLIYGKNASISGLDFGLINYLTDSCIGIQSGLIGVVGSNFTGCQNNEFINVTKGTFLGFQGGIFNKGGSVNGIQFGIFNGTNNLSGLQLGFINYAGTVKGLQIGVLNFIKTGGILPVMPIVNWTY